MPGKMKSVDYWKDFAKDNFEDNFEDIKKCLLEVDDESKDQVGEYSDDDSDEYCDKVDDYNEEKTRTFSTALNSVIRAGLPPQVKRVFIDAINTHLEQISNYISDFILPHGYLQEDIAVPNPLGAQLLKNEVFTPNYNQVFQDSHLELIHSTYYRVKGTESSFPFRQAITDVIPPSTVKPYRDLPPHSMKMARQSYLINFRQMWSDKTIANKALNRLLRSLLIIHLAPERDRAEEREALKARQQQQQADNIADNFAREEVNHEIIGDNTFRRIKRLLQIAKSTLFNDQLKTEYISKVSKAVDYGLVFSNRIYILPGLKTVRVYGAYEDLTRTQADEVPEKHKYQEGGSTVKAMNDQKSVLQSRLKNQVKQLDAFLFGNDSVRALKRKRRDNVGEFKKQNKHGQNTLTLITNEYNSSQTCLFCFNKLSHLVSAATDKISIRRGLRTSNWSRWSR
ncbi:hypothetical protein INT48_008267 [Thamnidium elegans]|uniref:Uncharacterized protein n=1 Tax=Thamnidium elegans TaxID=101142 RepID=A0A8H7VV11_9FUNG|nr:hypothetical protein INT48_008267 [Thamnidium elegans]